MKRFKMASVLIFIILQAGCVGVNSIHQGNIPGDIRRSFIGTWQGEYVNHEGKLLRTWIQDRAEDGTYTITFVHYTEEGMYRSEQKGKWWIDGDRFFEIAPDVMEEPDVYQFEILSEDEIRFESVLTDYQFIDRRMPDLRDVTFL